jgi:hypothetical protein
MGRFGKRREGTKTNSATRPFSHTGSGIPVARASRTRNTMAEKVAELERLGAASEILPNRR